MKSEGEKARDRVTTAAYHIAKKMIPCGVEPPNVAIMLGTGFEFFAHRLSRPENRDYREIPGFPEMPNCDKHHGRLWRGHVEGTSVWAFEGRVHTFDGYSPEQLALPIRSLAQLGVKYFITTGAVGSVRNCYRRGEIVMVKDHIAFFAENWLSGPHHESFGLQNFSARDIYSERLRRLAGRSFEKTFNNINHDVVVAQMRGPQYESAVELKAIETLGGDVVTFSIAPEALVAAQAGMEVLALACITNQPPSMFDKPLTKEIIEEVAAEQQEKIAEFLTSTLGNWPKNETVKK